MNQVEQSNLTISTVKDNEKYIANAVNVIFVRTNPETGKPQIAIHKRLSKKAGYLQWAIPGGTQEAGETMEETAIREMQEEVGVTIKNFKLDNIFQCITEEKNEKGDVTKLLHFNHFVYICDEWEGEFENTEPEKHTDLEWCDIDALPLDNFFITKSNIVNFVNGKHYDENVNIINRIQVEQEEQAGQVAKSNLTISTVKGKEKYIANAVNVLFVRPNPKTGKLQVAIHKRLSKKAGYLQWAIPGGTQEAGETMEETAIREMEEEVGVKLKNIKFNNMFQCITEEKNEKGEVSKLLHFNHFLYVCDEWEGEFENTEPEKHTDLEWCDIDALPLDNFFITKSNIMNFVNDEFYDESANLINRYQAQPEKNMQ